MFELTIDGKQIESHGGETILDVARRAGTEIPTLCYLKEVGALTSCMVCLVKDVNQGRMAPACATPAREGMVIVTNDEDVRAARREVLQLLINEHNGDCEAPCRRICPASLNIPLMLRHVQRGELAEAARIANDDLVIPATLGYVCSAPCERGCRRAQYDHPLSIRVTHRDVALAHSPETERTGLSEACGSVAVIGSGPAGLAAARELCRAGYACTVYEREPVVCPALRAFPESKLPAGVLDREIETIRALGVVFETGACIGDKIPIDALASNNDAVVVACGLYVTGGAVFKALDVPLVVRAVGNGKSAARKALAHLRGTHSSPDFDSKMGPLTPQTIEVYVSGRVDGEALEKRDPRAMMDKEAARCLHCDCHKPVACKLRRYAAEYGVTPRAHVFKSVAPISPMQSADGVVFDAGKCIKCGLCVEMTQRNGQGPGMAFLERGFATRVGVPFGGPLSEGLGELAHECVEACPTGALALR